MTINLSVPENSDQDQRDQLVALLKTGLRDSDQIWVESMRELAVERGFNADELEAEAQSQLQEAQALRAPSQPEPMSPSNSGAALNQSLGL